MKKPSIVFFLTILLLGAAICAQGQEEAVMDTDGNQVRHGNQYFIQPVNSNGGGLVPATIGVLPLCPLGITQTLLPHQPGLPVSFFVGAAPANLADHLPPIRIGRRYAISFMSDIWPVCKEFSTTWKVDDSSTAARDPAIVLNGTGYSYDQTSFFIVEKAGEEAGANTYKLTSVVGLVVGTIPGAWNAPQLVATKDTAKTLFVKFKKVEDATTATTSISRLDKLSLRMFPFY